MEDLLPIQKVDIHFGDVRQTTARFIVKCTTISVWTADWRTQIVDSIQVLEGGYAALEQVGGGKGWGGLDLSNKL